MLVKEDPKPPGRMNTCRKLVLATLIVIFVALFIFLSIPVPQESSFNEVSHNSECKPRADKFTRTIHQIWLNYTAFPEEWNQPISNCLKMNKNYTYWRWTAKQITDFLEKEYPWILDTYYSYTHNVQRVDAARIFILYHYGGIYMDMDLQCVRNFDSIIQEISAKRYDIILSRGATFGVSNHIMLAKPRHPYMKLAMESLPSHNRWYGIPYVTIMYTAGPGFLTVMLKEYPCKEQVYVFPPEPQHNAYYVNLHGGSWHTWDTPIIDKLGAIHKAIKKVVNWKVFCISLFLVVVGYIGYKLMKRRQRMRKMQFH